MKNNARAHRAAALLQAVNPHGLALFVRMLGDALARHPKGLPDIELQRVFEAHRVAIGSPVSYPNRSLVGHLEGGSQRSAELHQLHPRLVGAIRP